MGSNFPRHPNFGFQNIQTKVNRENLISVSGELQTLEGIGYMAISESDARSVYQTLKIVCMNGNFKGGHIERGIIISAEQHLYYCYLYCKF